MDRLDRRSRIPHDRVAALPGFPGWRSGTGGPSAGVPCSASTSVPSRCRRMWPLRRASVWQPVAPVDALSLLYRGALVALIHRDGIDFRPGDTEGDCRRRVAGKIAPTEASFSPNCCRPGSTRPMRAQLLLPPAWNACAPIGRATLPGSTEHTLSRRLIWSGLALAGLIVIGAAWFLANFDQVVVDSWEPRAGKRAAPFSRPGKVSRRHGPQNPAHSGPDTVGPPPGVLVLDSGRRGR